ncbi:MAG: aspartate carbamoyltransferase, partial [Enterovibrio sp.]
ATPAPHLLKGKVVASCFFEASTRTRLSFETAVQRLGGSVIGFADSNSTSAGKKGETLADSMRIISSYADAVVMRHPKDGAARLAAKFTGGVPVINAGDGANQHPSQTLLDLFTIYETQQRLDNLHIAMVGDLKYGRTVHSLSQALAKFPNNHIYFISPTALAMPDHILQQLQQNGQSYSQHASIEQVLPQLDILYMTRVQRERLDESEYQHIKSAFILDLPKLVHAKPNLKVLHPLPRVDEIDTLVDSTPHAYYFTQAQNGVYARQALLAMILNGSL